jgi:hypothetical protein
MELDSTTSGHTELRVHGVSGTPADQMLDHPAELVKQVAGGSKAGFWRRWYPGGTTHDEPDAQHLEAYAWGRLTSGPATRALWLILLPFTLVNVAHWMLPTYSGRRMRGATAVALLRLLGLSLTLMMLVATCTVAMDLGAWQCAAVPRCAARLGPFTRIGGLTVGQRLAVAALLPGLLVLLLLRLGHVKRHDEANEPPAPAVHEGDSPLADPRFWCSDSSTKRLRAAHVSAWCAMLAVLTAGPVLRYGTSGAWRTAGVAVAACAAVALALAVLATCSNPATSRGGVNAVQLDGWLAGLRIVAAALLLAAIVVVAEAPAHWPAGPTHVPYLRVAINVLLIVQALLLLGFTVCVAALKPWRTDVPGGQPAGYRVGLAGFGAPVMALLAWLVAGALSVGSGVWVARFLGTTYTSTADAGASWARTLAMPGNPKVSFADQVRALDERLPLIVPPPFFWAGAAAVVVLGVTLVVAAWCAFRVWRLTLAEMPLVQAQHQGEPVDDDSVRRVASVWTWAGITDRAGTVLGWMAAAATATMIGGTFLYVHNDFNLDANSTLVWLTTPGVSLIAGVAAGVVSLGFLAFRDSRARRTVGILWDLATFWPRANHPLTPPCYGEVAVPELVDRVFRLTAAGADRVVLSGHSQGSILVVAAVLQRGAPEPGGTRGSVALLTYGAPLRRLYARFFPAYFNAATFAQARRWADGHWVNLWAESDPIGSWVFDQAGADGVDRQLVDPLSLARGPDGAYPKVCGHSGFLARPEYPVALADLSG